MNQDSKSYDIIKKENCFEVTHLDSKTKNKENQTTNKIGKQGGGVSFKTTKSFFMLK